MIGLTETTVIQPFELDGGDGGRLVHVQKLSSLAAESWGFSGEEVCGVVVLLYPKFGVERFANRNKSGDFSGQIL